MKYLKTIDSINDLIGNSLSYLSVVIIVMVCWEIVARYFFNSPTIWASDGTVMLTGFMVILTGGHVQLHKRHIRIDSLYSHLGSKYRAIFDILTYILFCLFIYALVWHGTLFAWESIKVRETAGTPWNPIVYPLKAAIPIGGFLLWVQRTIDVVREAHTAFRKGAQR
jgi:TRAP-type mannitol/chloroaromatic compound transport system permease small subunit